MNPAAARNAWSVLKRPSQGVAESVSQHHRQEQVRGIRVKVLNGNLEWGLTFMQRKMQSSGIERMIKQEQTHHIKNSEKRVLARTNLERKLKSQDLARKLKAILVKKVRGLCDHSSRFLMAHMCFLFWNSMADTALFSSGCLAASTALFRH
ncbi:hypothetical protein M0R45_020653 [Rubus argutus]|uniref:Ribosomal protein S21 n=1 Tax=Rubus argutus TaxID=59490 RepID=A0AAW1X9F7_RUBAR